MEGFGEIENGKWEIEQRQCLFGVFKHDVTTEIYEGRLKLLRSILFGLKNNCKF